MQKLILTGASGLIGSHLLPELTSQYEVHAISRSEPDILVKNVVWHKLDLNGDVDSSILPDKVDAIVYLAQSENFRDFPSKAMDVFRVNTAQMLTMLDYGRKAGVTKFVYASSGGVYGSGDSSFSEDIAIPATGDLGFYLSTKLCAEILAENYKQFMSIVALRFFFVYGKGQKRSMLIPRLVDNVRRGEPIKLQGESGLLINPIHVSDAVCAIIASLKLDGLHKINVAGPEVLSLKRIAQIIGEKIDVEPIFDKDMLTPAMNLIGDIANMKKYLNEPLCYPADGFHDVI